MKRDSLRCVPPPRFIYLFYCVFNFFLAAANVLAVDALGAQTFVGRKHLGQNFSQVVSQATSAWEAEVGVGFVFVGYRKFVWR